MCQILSWCIFPERILGRRDHDKSSYFWQNFLLWRFWAALQLTWVIYPHLGYKWLLMLVIRGPITSVFLFPSHRLVMFRVFYKVCDLLLWTLGWGQIFSIFHQYLIWVIIHPIPAVPLWNPVGGVYGETGIDMMFYWTYIRRMLHIYLVD